MKKLGIIGGAGPLASALLYEMIIQERYFQKKEVPEIFLINYPFTRGLTLEEGVGNEEVIHQELTHCCQILEKHGVEVGLIACNTLHLYLPSLPETPVAFMSLPHLVLQEAKKNGHERLLILGTQNTCHSGLYQQGSLSLVYPSEQEQRLIDGVIDRVLEGNVCQQDSYLMSELIQQCSLRMDFSGVVLGCSDLPVLHHRFPISLNIAIYDSIKIPARRIGELL